jgi:tRNA 2-thiouridine synthesizing protein C
MTVPASRKILFLLRRPPYGTSHALEALETVLVAGVFDQQVSVLFSGDGVWQLLDGQDGSLLGRRTISRVLGALPEYDVTALYVCAESLKTRGLGASDLALAVTPLALVEQQHLIDGQDAVVND